MLFLTWFYIDVLGGIRFLSHQMLHHHIAIHPLPQLEPNSDLVHYLQLPDEPSASDIACLLHDESGSDAIE
jgi:hypothetical protein